ncbi:Tumor necrosis factor receptor superfamily member 18 [Acipenser ruthenus]|uniref:Tumor necrosis factor receptor superfamily member 18 n=1 Tax=Acipenser ruthenus TaxID=7906 RepID=A0A444U0E0_ACIRT|nr:Tumor necrosis factor receptor superfamily member 18 [Acipenser ruthenus]
MRIAQQLQSTVCVLHLFGMCIFGEGFSNSAAIKSTPEQCCNRCSPGTYKSGTSNPCTPCPLGTLSSEWNADKCKPCQCNEDNYLQCNATSKECQCKTGYIYKNPEHSRCIPMENCKRGTELKRSGTYKSGTSNPCTPCPLGTLSSEWNADKCKPCQCNEDNYLQCNTTSKECQCKTGYIYKNPEHSRCIPMENCKRGTELKRSGTISYRYTCEQCMNNTFSDTVGGTCKPWTDCQALGLITVTPGNHTHNAKCGCENEAGPDPLLKERCQLEDTCSCQISKEESGDKPVEDNSIKCNIIGA